MTPIIPVHRILVVEDDLELQVQLRQILEEEGYDTGGASTGEQALADLHANRHTALVLLDLWLPGMGGEQFRLFQLADRSINHIPVVILTAAMTVADLEALHACGVALKPAHLDKLFALISRCIAEGRHDLGRTT